MSPMPLDIRPDIHKNWYANTNKAGSQVYEILSRQTG